MNGIFPWQHKQWQLLMSRRPRLPHALLFAGAEGMGKKIFAHYFIQTLLCQQKNPLPCGECHSCHLFIAQSHPDFMLIEPEESGHAIKIHTIRQLIPFIYETALQGGLRIALIHPAQAMNMAAANALLKTLEEPAPNTLIILITNENARLPATILSRCQKIIFSEPPKAEALQWLQTQMPDKNVDHPLLLNLANGAPLKARDMVENNYLQLREEFYQGLQGLAEKRLDPLQFAAQLKEHPMPTLLNLLLIWLQDVLRQQVTQEQEMIINTDYQPVLTRLAQNIAIENLLHYVDEIKKIYSLHVFNLNQQLVLEELLIRWTSYATG